MKYEFIYILVSSGSESVKEPCRRMVTPSWWYLDAHLSFRRSCMKTLSKNIRKVYYVGFDVETYGDDNKFYMGGIYWNFKGEEIYKKFYDKDEMARFLLTRKFRNKYIVATNLDFDFTTLFYNTKYWNNFKMIQKDGRILLAAYNLGNHHGKIRFIDTMNYAMMSVEKLGKTIGIEKLPKPSFLGQIPETYDQERELEIYNKQDCKITYDFMNFFQDGINSLGGSVKLTIAATALHTWRMNFQPHNVIKEEYILRDAKIKDFIFDGYYGGRTEVFKRGTFHNVNYYDVNSLYPFVMKNDFPLPHSVKKVHFPSIENIMSYHGVTECFVFCPKMNKPLLPYRVDKKLMFPTGEFRGTYNNIELRKAIELGYKITPIKQIIYTQTWRPFDDYVDTMYNLRMKYKAENNAFETVVKLMLNSLYGKFGSRYIEDYKIVDISGDYPVEKLRAETKDREFDIVEDKLIYKEKKPLNAIYSFPILASYVTSYARLHMYEFLKHDDVIYMDTDSVIIEGTINGCDRSLGNMKHEGLILEAVFVRPKFYRIDKIVKVKGLNRATTEDFNVILNGGGIQKMKFTRLRESARKGISPNTKTYILKNMSLKDDKRLWEHQDLTRPALSIPRSVRL